MSRDLETIFATARQLREPDRAAYLDEACGGDAQLRGRVEALLAADADAGSFLKTAGVDPDATIAREPTRAPAERVGQMIGRYKLLEQIGEGGFGSVWAAEQREPVKRRVALKIIKLGMDTKQVIARFEAERQALAMMDHPNIAKVLDAGATETGRPFFAMELVKGVPILDYCDTEKLDTKARLDLFMKVCHAIQHAHQKGIIHRDIKPSNVMITLHDGTPVPKVIDFGIAKATNAELTEKTIYTQHHQMIGTPAYMSPEQAEMSGLDIDTRADIYSLGVLLYELLTGTTPFAHQDLMERGFAEMMRIIRDQTPHKPSTRLSTLGETGTRTAELRHTDIKKLGLILRGDLDWIVMKCLEKDRGRRYETANGLAADINRHLTDEPVLAGPPSAKYRLQKFVKRNRGQVIAGGVVAAALVLGVAGTSTGMVWALNERDRADTEATNASLAAESEKEARLDAQANEQKAIEEAERAERELARATEIKRLITEMLQSVDPAVAQTADKTLLLGILDDAAKRLKAGEITDELIAAELHHVVGGVYESLGLYPDAERHLPIALDIRRRVLGRHHPDTLRSLGNNGILRARQGKLAESEALFRENLAGCRSELGDEHKQTLTAISNMGALLQRQGRYDEAEPYFVEALETNRRLFGEEDARTLHAIAGMCTLRRSQGKLNEAEFLGRRVLELRRRVLGSEHPDTLDSMSRFGGLLLQSGDRSEAESLFREALDGKQRVLGLEHPNTLLSMAQLANTYAAHGQFNEAERLLLKTYEIQKRVLGEDHPDTLQVLVNLGHVYLDQGKVAEAEEVYLKTIAAQRRVLGDEHPDSLASMQYLAILYKDRGRLPEAESLNREVLEAQRRTLSERHPDALASMVFRATLLGEMGRTDDAKSMLREFLEIKLAAASGPDPDARTLNSAAWDLLTVEYEELRDPVRALALAQRACELRGWKDEDHLDTLALAQHMTGDTAAAIETQKRAIELAPDDEELRSTLARYEAALDAETGDTPDDQR